MKRKVILSNVIFLVLILSFTISAAAQWNIEIDEDAMTGEKVAYAISSRVKATEQMDFPYSDVEAWLGIGNDGENEWVYLGFSTSPNLSDTTTKDSYNEIETRIRWNEDEIEEVLLTQDWGAKFLHFRDYEYIISKIENSNKLLVELNWYGEGSVYFNFSLEGSSAAIDEIRSELE